MMETRSSVIDKQNKVPPHLSEISSLTVLHCQQRQVIHCQQLLHPLRNFSGRNHVDMIQPIQTQVSNKSHSILISTFSTVLQLLRQDKWVL